MWWVWLPIGWVTSLYLVYRYSKMVGQKSVEEAFKDVDHNIEVLKVAVLREFVPMLEDVMEALTDLLREWESKGRQQ